MLKYSKLILFFFIFSTEIYSTQLKKVLILTYNNITKNSDFDYLEVSIEDAVRTMLKKKFVFAETPKNDWEKIASDNYIFKDEYYTKSASMNLGLLARQDIVISGGFTIKYKQGKDLTPIIVINTKIYDISEKKILADFNEESPVSSEIFTAIQKVADNIAKEAEKVLPNKDEWKKMGQTTSTSKVFFNNHSIALKIGAGIFSGGWASHFEIQQPSLGLQFATHIPIIWKDLAMQFEFTRFQHKMKENTSSTLGDLNLTSQTTNYALGVFFLIEHKTLKFFKKLSLLPKLGGGYIFQKTEITGSVNENTENAFPFVGIGLKTSYMLNTYINAIATVETLAELEGDIITYVNSLSIGVAYKL